MDLLRGGGGCGSNCTACTALCLNNDIHVNAATL